MREEDFYVEQYDGDDEDRTADTPRWEGAPLPKSRRSENFKDRHLLPEARVRLLDYFGTRRMPPEEVVAAVRHRAWEGLAEAGGPLDAVGDRLYILNFLSMIPELSYIKVGRAANKPSSTGQVKKRISTHESEAEKAQALLFQAWISRPCATAVAWEKGVKDHLNAVGEVMGVGERVGSEYYRGISFFDAVRVARMQQEHLGLA